MDQAQSQEFLRIISQAGPSGSMWEAGQAMGLDRNDTETVATELMGQGHLEMVSLDGKVRLTQSGEELLGMAGPSLSGGSSGGLASLVADLKAAGAAGLSGAAATDLAADLACLAAQLERSQPLQPVVQACLKAIRQALAGSSQQEAQELSKRAEGFLD
jgi:hypothetical protein